MVHQRKNINYEQCFKRFFVNAGILFVKIEKFFVNGIFMRKGRYPLLNSCALSGLCVLCQP